MLKANYDDAFIAEQLQLEEDSNLLLPPFRLEYSFEVLKKMYERDGSVAKVYVDVDLLRYLIYSGKSEYANYADFEGYLFS
jgi:hypothetical protein